MLVSLHGIRAHTHGISKHLNTVIVGSFAVTPKQRHNLFQYRIGIFRHGDHAVPIDSDVVFHGVIYETLLKDYKGNAAVCVVFPQCFHDSGDCFGLDVLKMMQHKKRLMEYMTEVLPTMNIKRKMANFARDQPVNLLMDADADYMAELSMDALLHSDENDGETGTDPELDEILDYVLDKIIELLEYAVPRYCEAKGKTEDELTAEDGKIIFDRVMKLSSENTLCAIMLGQQFPEIHEISHDMCTAEDFGKKRNSNDYKNFINHWYHLKTEIGAMLSFESLSEYTECLDNEEADYRILRNAYYESLNEVDAQIFTLCEAGYKQEEITQMLGY